MTIARTFTVETPGRGFHEITAEVRKVIRSADVDVGVCHVFCHHTSASLIITENADRDVLRDLESFMARLVPDGDPLFRHGAEGPDDMPAHVRSVLTACTVTIPVAGSEPALGTWQGVFLWEHRTAPHRRRITVSVVA